MTLISPEYISQLRQLHDSSQTFGASGGKIAAKVAELAEEYKTVDILDYGCGKGELMKALSFPIHQYDPAVPGFETVPQPHDLVVCNDVLEHVQPEYIEAVLDDLKRVIHKVGYFLVATRPAKKTLPDGRNSHLLVHTADWWLDKLRERFIIVCVEYDGEREFTCVVEANRLR